RRAGRLAWNSRRKRSNVLWRQTEISTSAKIQARDVTRRISEDFDLLAAGCFLDWNGALGTGWHEMKEGKGKAVGRFADPASVLFKHPDSLFGGLFFVDARELAQ